ncbi:HD-GYP domain-containing protein, partial [Clostridiaceae bacterium HSG29]|nr:HD-GYP domain-containing protein [Clostridiaceae bacterium HSG29]
INTEKNYKILMNENEEITAVYQQLEAYSQTIDQLNLELNISLDKHQILIDSISDIHIYKDYDEDEYLIKVYEIAKKIISGYDYGMVFKYIDNCVYQLKTDGYNIQRQREIRLEKNIVEKCYPKTGHYFTKDSTIKRFISEERLNKFKKYSPLSKEVIYLSIKYEDNHIGGLFLEIDKNSKLKFNKNDIKIVNTFQLLVESYYENLENAIDEENRLVDIVKAMTNILEYHDKYTKFHSLNVANIAKQIGKAMKLSNKDINELYLSGLLHDLGKTFISKEILNKKEKLTNEEFDIIKNHPMDGFNVLNSIKNLDKIKHSVKHHHERWDGLGYPSGLKCEEILLETQILSVADAYDAMTTNRPYRKAFSKERAIEEIRNNSGKQFSPIVCEVFLKMDNIENFINSECEAENGTV